MIEERLDEQVRDLQPSSTLAINAESKRLIELGKQVYRFGLGQSPFPVPDQVVAALRAHAAEKDYLPVAGLPALREAVAAYHRRVDGLQVEADGVLIGPGSKELMFLLQLTFAAELVLPSPCWVSYAPQAGILGRSVSMLHTSFASRWRLQPEQLAAHCRSAPKQPRLLILNYPGNPEGGTYRGDELAALAEVAREHGVIVLSDEIYAPLDHRGEHISLARFYPEGTIVSGGLSKWCGAGGWRLGTFVFPPALRWLQTAMAAVASETYSAVSAPVQYAAVTAFEGSAEIERYVTASRQVLTSLGGECTRRLRRAGVRVHDPDGAFYLMLDFGEWTTQLAERGITSSPELCARLLQEAGVALLPGSDFGRAPSELSARLAYVDFDGQAALSHCLQLGEGDGPAEDFSERFCKPTIEGIDALCDWLTTT